MLQRAPSPANDAPAAAHPPPPAPLWVWRASLLLGALLFFVFVAAAVRPPLFGFSLPNWQENVMASAGLGLILFGLGTRASGTYVGWVITGSGAVVIALYLLFHNTRPTEPVERAVIAQLDQLPKNIGRFTVTTSTNQNGIFLSTRALEGTRLRLRLTESDLKAELIDILYEDLAEGHERPPLYLVARPFRDQIARTPAGTPETQMQLFYKPEDQTVVRWVGGKEEAVSCRPMECGLLSAGVPATESDGGHGDNAWTLLGRAFAQEREDVPVEKLLLELESDDTLVRREARRLLGLRSVEVLRPVLDNAETVGTYRAKLGAAVVLDDVITRVKHPEDVREIVDENDIARVASWVAHSDETMRYWATSALVKLADPRGGGVLAKLIDADADGDGIYDADENGAYNAALVLNKTFFQLDPNDQAALKSAVGQIQRDLGEKAAALLGPVRNAAGESATSGWVYIESEKTSPFGARLKEDEEVEVRRGAEIREKQVTYDGNSGWNDAPQVGRIAPGDTVRILSVQDGLFGGSWVQIERVSD